MKRTCKRFGQVGFAHHVLPVLAFVVLFAVIGTYFLVISHAATITATAGKTGELSSYLENSSGKPMCLADWKNGTANGTPVVIYQCSTTAAGQQWTPYSDHTIRIHGKCLDIKKSSTGGPTAIVINACNGGKNQSWTAGTNPNLSLNDLVGKGSGKCLDDNLSNTSNNNPTDLWTCNGTAAQVWGWNTNGKIVQGGKTVAANCHGQVVVRECYYWVGAYQQGGTGGAYTATGVSADFLQGNPTIGPLVTPTAAAVHSEVQFFAGTPDRKQAVEFAWYKDNRGANKGPTLQAADWVNGVATSALVSSSGYVPVSTTIKMGDAVKVSATGNYKITFVNNQWQLWYNGTEVGYFPESVWSSQGVNFTKLTYIETFGEIATDYGVVTSTQMGNGILGSKAGSTTISNYSLINGSVPAKLTDFFQPSGLGTALYDYGATTDTGMRLGGPGSQ